MGTSVTYYSSRIVGFEYEHFVWSHVRVVEPTLIVRIFHTKSLDAYVGTGLDEPVIQVAGNEAAKALALQVIREFTM